MLCSPPLSPASFDLLRACSSGALEPAREALRAGADPGAADSDGLDPLMLAARFGSEPCVRLLLPLCDPLRFDHARRGALMRAAYRGCPACCALLLPLSDVRAQDLCGLSALMMCSFKGHAHCAGLLAPSGRGIQDAQGRSALIWSVIGRRLACSRILMADPCEALLSDRFGTTALHWAALPDELDSSNIAERQALALAVARSGSPAARDHAGLTPSDMAKNYMKGSSGTLLGRAWIEFFDALGSQAERRELAEAIPIPPAPEDVSQPSRL